MKQFLSVIIALQVAFSPNLVMAQESPQRNLDKKTLSESPMMLTDAQSFTLPSGEIYTNDNTIVVAEDENQKVIAEKWFLDQMNTASSQNITYSVVGITTEGSAELSAARAMQLQFPAEAKVSTETIKKPLLERIKMAITHAKTNIKMPFARWVEKSPQQFKTVFAVARGSINGVFTSIVFNYFFLDGAIPTWLAWTTGLTLGTASGVLNYFSDAYSYWIDRRADPKTHDYFSKLLPFLNSHKINELKSLSKWAFLQAIFLAAPISFFQFLPGMLNLGEGYSFASNWITGLFAVSMTFVAAIFSQYPWEKGISRAHTSDSKYALDHAAKNWVKFRTALMYVVISGLEVTVSALSLGDYKISSYIFLGVLGLAGIQYRRKTVERTNRQEAEKMLNNSAKSCPELLSYLFYYQTMKSNPLSWVS